MPLMRSIGFKNRFSNYRSRLWIIIENWSHILKKETNSIKHKPRGCRGVQRTWYILFITNFWATQAHTSSGTKKFVTPLFQDNSIVIEPLIASLLCCLMKWDNLVSSELIWLSMCLIRIGTYLRSSIDNPKIENS